MCRVSSHNSKGGRGVSQGASKTSGEFIDTLEEKGLLIREKVANDRRVYALMPTEKGIALSDKVTSDLKHLDDQLLVGLSADDINAFQDVLMAIEENAKKGR